MSYLDQNGEIKDDLDVKVGSDLWNRIKEIGVENCKVTVTKAMDKSMPTGVRQDTSA